jgi:NAD(P)-dependent dehydrogenase (short-subunit alcohol dehydrogenase family)
VAFQGTELKRYIYIANNPLLLHNETYVFLITCRFVLITEGPVSQWRSVIDVNLLGLSICTKEALQSMKDRGVDDGHIIHISRCSTLTTDIHSFIQYSV